MEEIKIDHQNKKYDTLMSLDGKIAFHNDAIPFDIEPGKIYQENDCKVLTNVLCGKGKKYRLVTYYEYKIQLKEIM